MIAGVVLASGMSTRFGANKLLAAVDAEPVIRRTVAAYCGSALDSVLVVVGWESGAVLAALSGLTYTPVHNGDFRRGQSRALIAAIRALPPATRAAVIGVGDQPWLQAQIIDHLIDGYMRTHAPIVRPRFGGQPGNPVLFDRSLFSELLVVEGDVGGRPVLQAHAADALWIDVDDRRAGRDVDRPRDLSDPQSSP